MTQQSSAQAASTAVQRPLYAKLTRRIAVSVAVMVLLTIPSIALIAINHESASTWATASGIAGVVALLAGGVRTGVTVAIVLGLLAPIAIVVGLTPITGAALMAVMCMTVGRLSRFGLHRATLLVPVFMAWMILDPPTWGRGLRVDRTDADYLTWMAVIFFVGAIFPVIVLPWALRKVHMPAPKPHPRRESVPYTATITVLTAVSTYVLLLHPDQVAGAWLIATILVLSQVGDVGTFRMTLERVLGTALGLIAVTVVVMRVHSLTWIYIIGLIFAVAALTAKFSPHYWIYMALITPTVVCLNASSSSQVKNLEAQRGIDTLIGAALVLLSAGITLGYSHLAARRGEPPTVDEPTTLGTPASATPA